MLIGHLMRLKRLSITFISQNLNLDNIHIESRAKYIFKQKYSIISACLSNKFCEVIALTSSISMQQLLSIESAIYDNPMTEIIFQRTFYKAMIYQLFKDLRFGDIGSCYTISSLTFTDKIKKMTFNI